MAAQQISYIEDNADKKTGILKYGHLENIGDFSNSKGAGQSSDFTPPWTTNDSSWYGVPGNNSGNNGFTLWLETNKNSTFENSGRIGVSGTIEFYSDGTSSPPPSGYAFTNTNTGVIRLTAGPGDNQGSEFLHESSGKALHFLNEGTLEGNTYSKNQKKISLPQYL